MIRSRLRRASARSVRSSLDIVFTNGILAPYRAINKGNRNSASGFPRRSTSERNDMATTIRQLRGAARIGSRAPRATADLSSQRGKNLALLLLAMTQFVVVIDASIVNVALPSIGAHLHFSRADLSWVVNAYTLTFGGFLLLGGRLADLLGRRRMFMIGLVVFSLASLAGRRNPPNVSV